jgi:hypothetical protein
LQEGRVNDGDLGQDREADRGQSHLLENSTVRTLCSSDRALSTLKNDASTNVVNAMVCAYRMLPEPSINPPGKDASAPPAVGSHDQADKNDARPIGA